MDHRHLKFAVRTAFWCAAIVMPAMAPQDLSRQLQIDILPARTQPVAHVNLPLLGRRLLRRMLDQWPRLIGEVLPTWKRALLEAGWDRRGADTLGTLMACLDVLLHDHKDAAWIQKIIRQFEPLHSEVTADQVAEWRRLLDYILSCIVDDPHPSRVHQKTTVGALIRRMLGHGDGMTDAKADVGGTDWIISADRRLQQFGLKVVTYFDPKLSTQNKYLLIANSNPELAKLLWRTPWQSPLGGQGAWHSVLKRTPGAEGMPVPVRFAGAATQRALRVPIDVVTGVEAGASSEPPPQSEAAPDHGAYHCPGPHPVAEG